MGKWGIQRSRICSDISTLSQWEVLESLRAGATREEVESDEEEVESYDEEEVESDDEKMDMEDEESEEDEDYDEDTSSSDEEEYESAVEEEEMSVSVEEYDTQLSPPPGLHMGALLGVMLLSKKIDMFNPTVVRFIRFLFILYIIAQQAFLVYVRIQAKLKNDRTEIETTNPLSGLVSSQLGKKQGGDMVKEMASQFLSSKTTVLEYDLKQAKSMNSGLLVNMAFMWVLHFKMQQTQPLLAQTVTGVLNLVYSPLFQVYILGKNLERPFKNPASKGLAALSSKEAEAKAAAEDAIEEEEVDIEVDEIEVESSSSDNEDESDDDTDDGEDSESYSDDDE
jgi:archaellum component FlaD/FlaE